MSIFVSEMKGVQVIEVAGRLDGNSAPVLGRELDAVLAGGHAHIVLDLGSVDYISSPGLREIVRVFKRVQRKGGDLRIANPSDRVMDVMELAGLDTTLRIYYDTRVQAVDSFAVILH